MRQRTSFTASALLPIPCTLSLCAESSAHHTNPKLPPKYDAIRYLMATQDEDQYDGFAGEQGLERLAQMPVEVRLKRLERRERDNWNHLCEVIQESIARASITQQEREELKDEPLPEITDRRSFTMYVATVTRRLHQKLITGQEARALLYAAQLALAGLKGGIHG